VKEESFVILPTKFEVYPLITKIWKTIQNIENGVVWG